MTPKSYLSFIDSYKIIYADKIAHVGTLAERMRTGKAEGVVCPKQTSSRLRTLLNDRQALRLRH